MTEIDNWIKKQLKRGYKKEQIKESMRKAGYDQKTIYSVDSFKDKKNPIFVYSIVLILIVSTIILLFFNQIKTRENLENNKLDYSSTFSNYYISDSEKLSNFINICNKFFDQNIQLKELKGEQQSIEGLCSLGKNDENEFVVLFSENKPSFYAGEYICSSVELKDIIEEKTNMSYDDSFYLCNIVKPSMNKNELFSRESKDNSFFFPEGDIFCKKKSKSDRRIFSSFTCAVPYSSDYLNFKIYFVSEEDIPSIFSKDSFSEAEESLDTKTLLWQSKKLIKKY
jgi:hypothetical protein